MMPGQLPDEKAALSDSTIKLPFYHHGAYDDGMTRALRAQLLCGSLRDVLFP